MAKAGRQFAIMDAKGNYAAHTGPAATTWAGHKGGSSARTETSLPVKQWWRDGRGFEKETGHLSLRLMAALDAGQAAGGACRASSRRRC